MIIVASIPGFCDARIPRSLQVTVGWSRGEILPAQAAGVQGGGHLSWTPKLISCTASVEPILEVSIEIDVSALAFKPLCSSNHIHLPGDVELLPGSQTPWTTHIHKRGVGAPGDTEFPYGAGADMLSVLLPGKMSALRLGLPGRSQSRGQGTCWGMAKQRIQFAVPALSGFCGLRSTT